MKTLVFVIFLIISFPVLFSACQIEERTEIIEEESLEMDILSRGDADRWLLTKEQLRNMFKFDNTLNEIERNDFLENIHNFLLDHAPYRRVVYEVFQAIGNDNDKKINVTINPNHPDFRADNHPYALYGHETYSMIFPYVGEAMNGILVTHELIHHWQNLVIGKRAFYNENRRNIEFEVIFLLDVMLVQNQGDNPDLVLIQYFKVSGSQTAYTEDQKQEYLAAIRTTLLGNVHLIKEKLEVFAESYKVYAHVGYTPNWGFVIIDRLLNRQSENYIWR